MAKFTMPAGGIDIGGANGSAVAVHGKPEHAEGQAGVGNGELGESTTAQAVAMLESDEPEVDDMGELDGTIVDDLEGSIGEGGDLESQLDAACDAAFGEGQAESAESAPSDTESPIDPALAEISQRLDEHFDGQQAVSEQAAPEVAEPAAEQPATKGPSAAFLDWRDRVDAAEKRLAQFVIDHARLKAQTKAAKEEMEDATELLESLYGQNPEYNPAASPANTRPVQSYDGPASPAATSEGDSPTLASSGEAAAPSSPGNSADPDAWKSTPITALTSLTPKLIEKLQEAGLTTMGKLAARQEEISLSNGGEKWPKGIGEVKITAIEDAVIDWLNENRDREVFEDLTSVAAGEQASEQASGQAEGAEVDGVTGEDDAANYVADADKAAADAIAARALVIDNGESGALDALLPDAGYWELGWNHYEDGSPIGTCELPASPAQDDFIRGYLSAAKADQYGKANPVAAAEPAPSAPPASPSKPATILVEISMDDL